ncbi:Hypothetical protein SCF082_LOCUS16746 [Durusdinium trenchii]|uniref:Uncharacterized protein n=1 Tax=Durusdinium trenchii TaxID=1381693 RepID=A0ABP0KF45_9DINO
MSLTVESAGWTWANGTYVAVSTHEDQAVYKNPHGFLLSYELDSTWQGWVLGFAGHPLYAAPVCTGPWRVVPGWGKEPPPTVALTADAVDLAASCRADASADVRAAANVDAEEARATAAWNLDRAVDALAREDWSSLEEHLSCASKGLAGEAEDSALQVELRALQCAAVEGRMGALEGDDADQGLQEPKGVTEATEADGGRPRALTKAAEAMKEGDRSREEGHIFKADEWYSAGLRMLSSFDATADTLRCSLLLKRAQVLQQKWQHKEVLTDCRSALEICTDDKRQELQLLAAEACKSLHDKANDTGEATTSHWMQLAVRYLESATGPGDHALQRRLRSWRRQLPPRPQPVPMPPFDWSTVPMAEKARYFGDIRRDDD